MFYKPKYCCNCGEKIERVDWNILTSRRFCGACSVENKGYDYLLRGLAVFGILGTMFGLGSLFGGSGQGSETVKTSLSAPAMVQGKPQEKPPISDLQAAEPKSQVIQNNSVAETAANEPERPRQTNATQYFCGALTKKGTPCSRKVKASGGRCFQHEGKSAAPAQNQ